ncbi:conjugal transfer protein TraP [Cronobacter sakazakii]|uniref:conjugal transfer protein TraP n=1 Tax=Cronobacter sakazakii TaxID=28141 RepID=UPI00398BC7D5
MPVSEFDSLPPETPTVSSAARPVKKESLLTRPLFLGQSLPWLVGFVLAIVFAAWYLFWPASTENNATQLAFGQSSDFESVQAPPAEQPSDATPLQTGGLSTSGSEPGMTAGGSTPEEIVKLIREGRDFEAANREAITRLSETVRAQGAALSGLQKRLDDTTTAYNQLVKQYSELLSRKTVTASYDAGHKSAKRSLISGMQLESVQDGMAWVRWEGRTWAVQEGQRIGSVTIQNINVADRSVITSAGILR